MNLFMTFLLAFMQTGNLALPQLELAAPFEQPFNTVGTNWVLLNLETGRQGNIQSVEVLQGISPFVDIALGNVRQWMFAPAVSSLPPESRVGVVFLFRPPDLFAGSSLSFPESLRRGSDRPPVPMDLTDPGYPVNSIAEGVAILQMNVAPAGTIENVRVVTDTPSLAAYTEKVVRGWKFQPAVRNGMAVTGTVIVVASYLRPVVYNNAPMIGVPSGHAGGPVLGTFQTEQPAVRPEFRSR